MDKMENSEQSSEQSSASSVRPKRDYQVISNEMRKLILEKLESGQSLTDVAKMYGVKYDAVRKMYKTFQTEGRIEKKKCGQKWLRNAVKVHVMDNKSLLSLNHIKEEFSSENDENDYNVINNCVYYKNDLLFARIVYQCVDCIQVFNTFNDSHNHYICFHQNNSNNEKNDLSSDDKNAFHFNQNQIKNRNIRVDKIRGKTIKTIVKNRKTSLLKKNSTKRVDYNENNELKEFKCELSFCNKTYYNLSSFLRHQKLHTNPRVCEFPDCNKMFSSKYELENHKPFHISNEIRLFKCEFCDKTYKTNHSLTKHKNLHTNPKRCDFKDCGKLFACNAELKVHQLSHTDECPLKCDYPNCDYTTKILGSIKTHKMHIHSNERPFKCPDCEKAFKMNIFLKNHISRVHKKERKYGCEWPGCDRSFSSNNILQNHRRTHTGERPYACDWPNCGQRFAHHSVLRGHRYTHTGERPYPCDWPGCEARFSSRGTLGTHKKLVHKCDGIVRSRWDKKKIKL